MAAKIPIGFRLLLACLFSGPVLFVTPAPAEWYVAGQGGVNFADRLTNVEGTGASTGILFQDLDLQNSITVGGKIGYFPQHGWVGIEGEVFHSTPHIKGLGPDPGIHLRVTTIGANFILRYPGRTFQPYIGIGGGAVVARLGSAAGGVQSDTDLAGAWNVLAGIRAFVTPHIAVFTEYKFQAATLQFDGAFGTAGGFESTFRAQHVLGGLSYHF